MPLFLPLPKREPRRGSLLPGLSIALAFLAGLPAVSADDNTPKAPEWYYEQGKTHLSEGDYQQAAEAFKVALDRSMAGEPAAADPQELARWHAERSRLHLRQKEFLLAQSHADRALELQPKSREYKKLAREAAEAFTKEQRQLKRLAEAIQTAAGKEAAGDYRRAMSFWKRAKAIAPQDPRVTEGIARVQSRLDAKHPRVRSAAELTAKTDQRQLMDEPNTTFTSEYLVSSGDVIEVFVWQQPDLSRDVLVRPDGKLSFPLVGDIAAAGLNLTQLDQQLTARLKTYIRFPDVSLAIKRFGGTKTIVLGEVGAPGVYVPTGQGGVLQVIAMAGGFTKDAASKSVMLIRGGLVAPEVAKLNLRAALEQGKLEENIILQPNDIVFVPRNEFADTLDFIAEFSGPMGQVLMGQSIATNFGARETSGGITR